MAEFCKVEREGHVWIVTINRPEVMNSLHPPANRELAAVWDDECEQAGKPRFHVLVPGPVASPQRAQSHPSENRAALPTPERVAVAYLRLLGPEGRGMGPAPLDVVA